jgi:hypothetical protein
LVGFIVALTVTETFNKEKQHSYSGIEIIWMIFLDVPNNSAAVPAQSFDVNGYRTYWQGKREM